MTNQPSPRRTTRSLGTRLPAALLVGLVLTACGQAAPGTIAARERVEANLADTVAPVLADDVPTEDAWEAFDAALVSARTDDVLVVRARDASSGYDDGGPGSARRLATVVAIVGPEDGECVAMSVTGDGTVRSVQVSGDAAANCAGARVPSTLP